MQISVRSLLIVLVLLGCGATARAQDPFPRHSVWGAFGLGLGSASHSCDQCTAAPRGNGTALFFNMGGSPSPKLQVGGEFMLWSRALAADTAEGIGDISAALYYFPRDRRRFFLETALGLGIYLYGVPRPNGDHVIADSGVVEGGSWSSWDLTLATGYDIPVSRRLALRSRVAYDFANIGNVSNPDLSLYATGWKQNLWTAGFWLFLHRPTT